MILENEVFQNVIIRFCRLWLDRKDISAIFIMLEVIKISTYDTKQSYLNCYYVEQI